jgi:alkylation response protein AidB-like acyl-CoA dehydrogenase
MELMANERDMQFLLFEYLGVEKLLSCEKWKDFDVETFRMTLSEAIKFAAGVTAPLNATGDAEGAHWNDGVVTTPKGYREAYRQYCENGWLSINANPEFGGQGFPLSVSIACLEALISSNCSFAFTPELTSSAARVIDEHGSDQLKSTFLEKMLEGTWAGTMCLTEAGAGSAVGDLRTKASRNDDGTWNIEGTKTFITSGDHDLAENIMHLVLARTPDAPPGIKGISLFAVPKYWVNEDGSTGEANDVQCTGIEHKMGIHASPTCSLSFGEAGKCRGWLIGDECKGIVYMFTMMNEARLGVGLQGTAVGSQAYEMALAYTKERIQGTDLKEFKNPEAARVPIIKHPDVRRLLMTMKSYVEGCRAMIYATGFYHDLYEATGDENLINSFDLLTPVIKAYCTDIGFKVTELAIQAHGGYGYIGEYGVEQLCRDAKIASLYEGTNGIQALDLIGRKLGAKGGAVLMSFLNRLNTFVAKNKKHEALGELVKDLEGAKNKLVGTTMAFRSKGAKNPYYPAAYATPYLEMFAEVTMGYFLMDMALVAHDKLEALYQDKGAADDAAQLKLRQEHPDGQFYWGKIQTARFFVKQILPGVHAKAMSAASDDMSLMDVEL